MTATNLIDPINRTEEFDVQHEAVRDMMGHDPICHRCGLCCYYIDPITKVLTKCKWLLIFNKTKKTACRVWSQRCFCISQGSNFVIDRNEDNTPKIVCISRRMDRFNHLGCGYNTGSAGPCFEDIVNNPKFRPRDDWLDLCKRAKP
jgi:hypothetical protein